MSQYYSWGAWQSTSIDAASIANGNSLTTGSISANLTFGSQVSLALTFSATYNAPCRLEVINEGDGIDEADQNLSNFAVNGAASSPGNLIRSLPGFDYPNYKLRVVNPSGGTVTGVTVKVRHPVVDAT